MTDKDYCYRIYICGFIVSILMLGTFARVSYLFYGNNYGIDDVVEKRKIRKQIKAVRGSIYDRNRNENTIAVSVPVFNVCVDPMFMWEREDVNKALEKLSSILEIDKKELLVKLGNFSKRYAVIARNVAPDKAKEVLSCNLKGVTCNLTYLRRYPNSTLMAHVLGFLDVEERGVCGIEYTMDKYLRGTPGYVEVIADAKRRELYSKKNIVVQPIQGASVELTLDVNIQYAVERALDAVMEKHNPEWACAIVERVNTGEIIAMASRPTFDPNYVSDISENQMKNACINIVYEPGSTFKVVTLSAAFEEDIVKPEDVFYCEQGAWRYCGTILRDTHPYDSLNVIDGFKKSSNILHAKIGILLDKEVFYKYIRRFGFGSVTGIELSGEETGICCEPSGWSKISPSRISIGYEIAVTPLQMLQAVSSIANDGVLMKPYIVKRIIDADGRELIVNRPQIVRRVVSKRTASLMRTLMCKVVEEGTGSRAALAGYSVGGKTGTAHKSEAGGYSSTRVCASFVGFFPAKDPQISMIVVVNEPKGSQRMGGSVAAPVFAEIAQYIVRYFTILPDKEEAVAFKR